MRSVEELLGLLKAGKASDVEIERNRNGGVDVDLAKARASAARLAVDPRSARCGRSRHAVTTAEKEALIAAGGARTVRKFIAIAHAALRW